MLIVSRPNWRVVLMSDVEALRTLVDAIEDELRTHQPMTYPAGLFIRIKTVLEGLVSAPTETTVEIGGQVMTESQYNAAQFPYKHAPGRVSPASTGDDEAARAVYAAQYPDAPEMFDHPELKRERNLARRLAAAALSVGRVSPVVYEYATEYFHKGKPGYAGIMCDLERAKSWTRNQKQNDLNVSTVCRIKAVPASEWEPVGVEK